MANRIHPVLQVNKEVRKLDFKVQGHTQLDVPPPYWRPPGLYRLTPSKEQGTRCHQSRMRIPP